MSDGQNEKDQNAGAKEQAENDEHAADAAEERADKTPHLEMRMNTEIPRAPAPKCAQPDGPLINAGAV
jgi:hypothetical protein